jgi:hypothetical protein
MRSGANMKICALFLLLLIATAVLALVVSVPEVKAEGNVIILSDTIYQNYGYAPFSISKGDYIVAGEVQNVGAETVHFNITAVFYDVGGSVIGTSFLSDSSSDTSPCYFHVLLPDRRSPFTVWFSRFDETGYFRVVDHYSLQVSTSSAGVFHSGFAIVSDTSHEAGGSLFVEGDLKNIGTNYIDGFNVFATFYKENGNVLAVSMEGGSYTLVDPVTGERGFPPNQTASFGVALNGFNEGGRLEEFSRYELTAEGYDYSLWSSDRHLINPEVVYVLGVVQEPVVPVEPVDTDGFPFVAIIAAATVIVVLLVVLFLVLKRSRKGSLQKSA